MIECADFKSLVYLRLIALLLGILEVPAIVGLVGDKMHVSTTCFV